MEEPIRSAQQLVKIFEMDKAMVRRLKADPIPVLKEAAVKAEEQSAPAYYGDKWLYRIAISVLCLLALTAAVGSLVLGAQDKAIPEALVALGSAAVGALVGLFAPSPTGK